MPKFSVKDHIPAVLIKKLDAKGIEIVLRDKALHRERQKQYRERRLMGEMEQKKVNAK